MLIILLLVILILLLCSSYLHVYLNIFINPFYLFDCKLYFFACLVVALGLEICIIFSLLRVNFLLLQVNTEIFQSLMSRRSIYSNLSLCWS